jgi:transcription-repair coupling factor (superfamily II helicase)
VLYITPGDREAARIAEDVSAYLPNAAGTLATRERQFVRAAVSHERQWQRLQSLGRVRTGDMRVLCVSAETLLYRFTPPALYDEMTVTLSVGDVIEPRELMARFAAAGFERVDMVEGKGQCALRGSIVDVFPPCETNALRIEFFDDEVDGMRTFDCISQRSVEHLDTARIAPAGEYLLRPEDRAAAGERMRNAVKEAARKNEKAQKPSCRRGRMMKRASISCPMICAICWRTRTNCPTARSSVRWICGRIFFCPKPAR